MVSSMPLLDGSPHSSDDMIFVKFIYRKRDLVVTMMLQPVYSVQNFGENFMLDQLYNTDESGLG
jgi:hypothetical protein